MQYTTKRQIWAVRHGLRMDFLDKQWINTAERYYDSPLHADGKIQAEETGCRLGGEKIDYIFASPFLRTLQTANIIAKRLKMKFYAEAGFSEWLKEVDFPGQPLVGKKAVLEEDFTQWDRNYRSLGQAIYPEDHHLLDGRIAKTTERIFNNFPGNILIISHASPIDALFKYCINEYPGEFQTMCAISCFEHTSNGWNLAIDRDMSHLSIKDMRNREFYKEFFPE